MLILASFTFLVGCGEAYQAKYANLKNQQLGVKNPTAVPGQVTEEPEDNTTPPPTQNAIEDVNDPCFLPKNYIDATTLSNIQSACLYTNIERENSGLPPVELELVHSTVAQTHAEDMVLKGYFSHTDQEGNNFRDRLLNAGVNFSNGGENIAYGVLSGIEVISLWMSSGPHRVNILKPEYTKMGIGYYQTYWVQVFTD